MPTLQPLPEGFLEAVRDTLTIAEFLQRIGSADTKRERKRVRQLLRRRRIDTTHWRRTDAHVYSDELLRSAVAASTTYVGVLRWLGIPPTGGSHAYLARRIRAGGFDTSHFLGKAHSRGTSSRRLTPAEVLVVRPEGSHRVHPPTLRRALAASQVPEVCVLCGCDGSWRGSPLRLIVDHINGDYLDNRLENLRFLCPNCHAQTATWCRKKSARTA